MRGDRRGFTLVEMLVVIAIIVLLISISLPSLAKSRKRARDVTCLSNLRQWGIAIQTYLDANSDYFAIAENWADLAGNAGDPVMNPGNLYNANNIPADKRPLNIYLRDERLAECPSDLGDSYDSPAFDSITNCYRAFGNSYQAPFSYDVLRTAYAYGDRDGAGVVNVKPKKYNAFKVSYTNKVIQGDFVWWGNRRIEFPKSRWHADGARRQYNILFADWHAEFTTFPMDQEAFWPGSDPAADWRNEWW